MASQKKGDVVDQVLQTVSLPHSVKISSLKASVEEQLRLLNIKAPMKQLGKGDSTESRKLVLLETLLKSSNARIPANKLAGAVGMKKAAFEALSSKAANYINIQPKRRASSSQKTVQMNAPSTIPALSIRLGSQVPDSVGFARRAEQLLRDIQQYLESTTDLSAHKKKAYLQDIQRSHATYEAVCFYVVAQGRKMKRTAADDEEYGEGDFQLTTENVIEASSVSAPQFRNVLPVVTEFAAVISKQQQEKAQQKPVAKTTRKRGRSQNASTGKNCAGASEEALELLGGVEAAANSEARSVKKRPRDVDVTPRFIFSDKFLEWKRGVLGKVCQETKQRLLADDKNILSDADAIRLAAGEVASRYEAPS